jgi:hypothetical protein
MKRHWRVRRETVARPDAMQRRDRAYQSILQWSLETRRMPEPQRVQEEVYHAGSGLRPGLDLRAGQAPDD